MSLNWFVEPIGWFVFFIGAIVIGNMLSSLLSSLGSKGKGKLQTKAGIIVGLLVVGILWFVFSAQIASLFEQVQQHAVQVIAILLVLIAVLVYFKKGN
jgi:hypothetical protein